MADIPAEWSKVRGTQRFAKKGNAARCDLRGADLTHIRVERWDVNHADLREADLDDFRARDSDFEGANFVGAACGGAMFFDCVLSGATFAGCLMQRCMISASQCNHTMLEDAVLRGADLFGTSFVSARLARADLRSVNAKQAAFDEADLTDADLRGGNFEQVDFRRARLTGVRWDKARLTGAKFDLGTGAAMLDDALRMSPEHPVTAYKALDRRTGVETSYAVERRADGHEAIRIHAIESPPTGLVLTCEILDENLPELVAYALIVKVLLQDLLAAQFGSASAPLTFRDKPSTREFTLPA
ncbi:MAG TPA: pentapeptide repeat-containing protein [Polyangiaceae bacterium]|nr:pentapeptide repeat-containing protein [Polyangiaceae bacterium]